MIRSIVAMALLLPAAVAQTPEPQPKIIPSGYRVETIETPKGVPFGVGGLSFAADGTLYASTREGDVWTYKKGMWKLFAKGLHEPLGVFVDPKNGRVFVVQRPELTELIDSDGDGVPDLYCVADGSPNLLYRNDGGHFTEMGILAGVAYDSEGKPLSGMGVSVGGDRGRQPEGSGLESIASCELHAAIVQRCGPSAS